MYHKNELKLNNQFNLKKITRYITRKSQEENYHI